MDTELLEVRNYSDVCNGLGIKELRITDFLKFPSDQRRKLLAAHKILNIAKLFNGDWILNWKDDDQRKWYPYFTTDSSTGLGWVFRGSHCCVVFSYGQVSFYKDEQTSNHCGELFLEIYVDLFDDSREYREEE